MKKVLFLLFIVAITAASGLAQNNWVPTSAKWECSLFEPSSGSYPYRLSVTGEKVIAGKKCQVIGGDINVYTSNDTVFFYLRGKFRPTYYYNAKVGDTVNYYNTELSCEDKDSILYAVVTSVDTLQIKNQILRRFNTTLLVRDTMLRNDTVGYPMYEPKQLSYTEKVGANYIYPYFYARCVFDQSGESICNYGDSTIDGYYLEYPTNCRRTAGIFNNEQSLMDFTISPNPATQTISVATENPFNYIIYNLLGQAVVDGFSQANEPIEVNKLPKGFYVLRVSIGTQSSNAKFLKE